MQSITVRKQKKTSSRQRRRERKREEKKQKEKELDGQGKARREAARSRNSECKTNLSCRNSSRSNDSWRMSPKSTKYSAAAIGRRSDQ